MSRQLHILVGCLTPKICPSLQFPAVRPPYNTMPNSMWIHRTVKQVHKCDRQHARQEKKSLENEKPSEVVESLFPVSGTTWNVARIEWDSKETKHHFIWTSQSALGVHIRLEPLQYHGHHLVCISQASALHHRLYMHYRLHINFRLSWLGPHIQRHILDSLGQLSPAHFRNHQK